MSTPLQAQNICEPKSAKAGELVTERHTSSSLALQQTQEAVLPQDERHRHSLLPVQVYVSRTWKFIYVRNPKSSSTALLHSIKQQMCGGQCSEEQLGKVATLAELEPMWEEYFVFTVVRNPWTRALSAYNMFTQNFLFKCGSNLRLSAGVCVAVPKPYPGTEK